MKPCDAIQEKLLEIEPDQIDEALDAELASHADECPECSALIAALRQVDGALHALPPLAPTPELIERAVQRATEQEPAPIGLGALLFGLLGGLASGLVALVRALLRPLRHRPVRWGIGLAVPAVGALALLTTTTTLMRSSGAASLVAHRPETEARGEETSVDGLEGEPPPRPRDQTIELGLEDHEDHQDNGEGRREVANPAGSAGQGQPPQLPALAQGQPSIDDWHGDDGRWGDANRPYDGQSALDHDGDRLGTFDTALGTDQPALGPRAANEERNDRTREIQMLDESGSIEDLPVLTPREPPGVGGRHAEAGNHHERATINQTTEAINGREDDDRDEFQDTDGCPDVGDTGARPPGTDGCPQPLTGDTDREAQLRSQLGALGYANTTTATWWQTDVTYRDAHGIWANTYVPGDPSFRLLRRRLMGMGDAALAGTSESALALAEHASPLVPSAAAPTDAALGLSVSADRATIEGQSRVRLQVALRGAAVHAGRRPALRAMFVLDLRQPLDADGQARVRALLSAASRARASSDRIGIAVAGPHGGVVLPPEELRFGQVAVALRRVFSDQSEAAPMDLPSALRAATQEVGSLGEDSPLGSALVLVVSPQLSMEDASALEPSVHAASLAGVTTSAIGLTDATATPPLEALALAGQGRRRVLGTPAQAEQLVDDEVQATSRVVARAIHLTIRLAPGVHLVEVLGSHPLSELEGQHARAEERAIDSRLAHELGIQADRQDDQDGIQMIIPAFYGGDSHVVLLDLVADQPGAVADVQVRFKDLLHLRNGSADARWALERGRDASRPAQRAVVVSHLAYQVSAALAAAADRTAQGDAPGARAQLARARDAIAAERAELRELASDRSLSADLDLCARYERALAGGTSAALADSLRYASRRRLHGDPLGGL